MLNEAFNLILESRARKILLGILYCYCELKDCLIVNNDKYLIFILEALLLLRKINNLPSLY